MIMEGKIQEQRTEQKNWWGAHEATTRRTRGAHEARARSRKVSQTLIKAEFEYFDKQRI